MITQSNVTTNELPKTGDAKNNLSIIGLAMFTGMVMFGLNKKKCKG